MGRGLSYSNVMATIAVFIALGGGAYAATAAHNSVKSSSIKNGQVRKQDLHSSAVISPKIGTHAVTSSKLSSTALAPETTTYVSGANGADNCPSRTGAFCGLVTSSAWDLFDFAHFANASFYRDREGSVHLGGLVQAPAGAPQRIFLLPPADSPGLEKVFTATGAVDGTEKALRVDVLANGEVQLVNTNVAAHTITYLSLDGITFRAGEG